MVYVLNRFLTSMDYDQCKRYRSTQTKHSGDMKKKSKYFEIILTKPSQMPDVTVSI